MSSVNGATVGFPVDFTKIRKLEGAKPLTEEQLAMFKPFDGKEYLEQMYTKPDDWESHPSQQLYATVQVDGKVVARLYNSGAMETSNQLAGKLQGLPSMLSGPAGAQVRADWFAKKMGGTVVMEATAVTPQQYDRLPPLKWKLDVEAMKNDPMYGTYFRGEPNPRTLAALVADQEEHGAA